MLLTAIEQEQAAPSLNPEMEIRQPSILKIVFVMIVCVCSLALAGAGVIVAIQKATAAYMHSRKRTPRPARPYYYSIISG